MSDEQLMVERAAETVAQIVAKDAAMLTDSDPLRLVMPHISELEHGHLVHVSLILLQRFRDTASGRVPELEPLVSVSDSLVAPALSRLEQCMAARPAFQSANSLTPLLTRAVVLAAQCCSLVVRDVTSAAAAVHPLCSAFTALGEVITSAVLERVEQFRPLDSSVIFRAHQTFVADQAKIRLAVLRQIRHDIRRADRWCQHPGGRCSIASAGSSARAGSSPVAKHRDQAVLGVQVQVEVWLLRPC